jgi:nuclear transport factor 2 (NTF2) superfamily protein
LSRDPLLGLAWLNLPAFGETGIEKLRAAKDAWNTRNPRQLTLAYTVDSKWRNREGRDKIVEFLIRK